MPQKSRPEPTPERRLTLQQIAQRSGLSYSRVYKLVIQDKLVPTQLEGNDGPHGTGHHTVALSDAKLIHRRPPPTGPRRAIAIRIPKAEHRLWEQLAGETPVSTWLIQLARERLRAAGLAPEAAP